MTNYEELCKLDTERTQGDWQVDSEYTRDPEVIIHCGNYAIAPIIRHGMMGHTGREMSDAQFIAAAPEMMAMLKKHVNLLEEANSQVDELSKKVNLYREALEFYAYNPQDDYVGGAAAAPEYTHDYGKRAKEALDG